MGDMLRIGEAAMLLGVCADTLRRWEREGKMMPDWRTPGGERRYHITSLATFRHPMKGTPDQMFHAAAARQKMIELAGAFDAIRADRACND